MLIGGGCPCMPAAFRIYKINYKKSAQLLC
nr:MAG TPA: hypothetical protein [Caudoviricetes sp.]